MIYQPKFFYNDGAGEGAGGADTETKIEEGQGNEGSGDTGVEGVSAAAAPVEKIEISLEQAKAWGFDSKEQLDEHFAKLKEQNVSEEEKRKAAALEDINFRKFAVENDLLKEEDILAHQSLSARADRDLVFDKWLNDFKEDNPELENDPELLEKATTQFNSEYKLDSENEKTKERAIAKLQREAKELRAPAEAKFTTAKSQYDLAKSVQTDYPKFEKFVQDKVKQHTPDKAVLFKIKDGEEEIGIEIELTDDDRKEMAKSFATHKNFFSFKNGTKEEFEASLDKKMQSWVRANKSESIARKSYEIAYNRGIEKGSVGASHPFPLVERGNLSQASGNVNDEQKIRDSHNAAAQDYIR